MKQILQDLKTGKVILADVPCAEAGPGQLLIRSTKSLISSGTERMLLDFGKASYLQKARQQPEKIKMVFEKIQADGLMPTMEAVRAKLEQPLPLGYCNAGVVIDVGEGVTDFKPGDRVASNGSHAEIVKVPKNLCARIPDSVDDALASFTIVGSIGLQGIRLVQPTIGETVVVTGVGLIGLITVQLLLAQGCRVLAIDYDSSKLELAARFGAEICNPGKGEDPVAVGMAFSRRKGVDAVVIAAATRSNDPITQAARMCRKRGRIVLIGVTGLEINRTDFYEKELSFQVSCSYGPGRYDPEYEEKGRDYPLGFVRWTEQRNFEAVLDLMASGQLNLKQLITHRFDFKDAPQAYKLLSEDRSALGILLEYPPENPQGRDSRVILHQETSFTATRPVVGFIGAGNYASRVLIPAFKSAGAQLHTIVSAGGLSGAIYGERAGFSVASTNAEALIADDSINTITIATRHDSHARFVSLALEAGRHVFVEKPLAINIDELTMLENAYAASSTRNPRPLMMVGFNRRFAPHIQKLRALLNSVKAPKSFIMTMNAGAISAEHWTQDKAIGGGRIIGEACHLIDLMRFLAGNPIISLQARCMGSGSGASVAEDKAAITLGFADGSFGTVHYLANGAANFPKERIEVFTAGRVLQLDNYRKLKAFGWPGFRKMNRWRQDKGQKDCVLEFVKAIETGGPAPIPPEEIFEVSRVSIEASRMLQDQQD